MCRVEFIPPETDKGSDEILKIAENQGLEVRIRHWAGYRQFSAVAPPAQWAQLLWKPYLKASSENRQYGTSQRCSPSRPAVLRSFTILAAG